MEISYSAVEAELRQLIAKARAEGKWLWCAYQDLWFSPDKLEAANAQGKFRWGAVNWKLRDPEERIEEAQRRRNSAQAEVDRVIEEVIAAKRG